MHILGIVVGVALAAMFAGLGWTVKRLIDHLDKLDRSVNKLHTDMAILFDRGMGIPKPDERERVVKKVETIQQHGDIDC